MKPEYIIVIITSIITLLIIMGISYVAQWCTRNSKKRGVRKFNYIANKTFKITKAMLTPIGLLIKAEIYVAYGILCIFGGFFGMYNSGGNSYLSSSYSNSNSASNYNGNTSNSSNGYSEKSYCHYNDSKVTTIDSSGRVYRSDGVTGCKHGEYVYYNDGTKSRVIMFDDENGIIE